MQLIQSVIIEEDTKEENKTQINWQELKNINKDIIGWIRIKDTHIDYPVLQDNNNLMYLKHSFNKNYNKNGSIFTLNSEPFCDNITILYGHNTRSGLMFTDLEKYMNTDFYNEHTNFEIYTENQNYTAEVFSIYSTGVKTEENNIKSLNFANEVEYYKKMSVHRVYNIGKIEKIVKLSTCSYLNNHSTPTNQRYYIVASLKVMN